ncbi:MAG: hypothetical protein OM95_14235 [Bdellovibrio sp. ArHS]|nr:MAG: hypothetical protein OM95_14235 [Bdellovibrio sp. ArHS]
MVFLALFSSLLVGGCTSDEKVLKNKALALAEKKFTEQIKQEADDSLGQSPWLHQAYTEFIHNNSEVSVEEVKMQSDTLATVAVVVETYPTRFRRTILGIAARVDASKSRRFNFSEARGLIIQQGMEKGEVETQPLGIFKFHKSDKNWILD